MHHSTRRGFLGAAATSTALASLPAGVAAARNKKPGRYIDGSSRRPMILRRTAVGCAARSTLPRAVA
jgi:hypothetical protein